jgi:hypothetical protein
MSKLKKEEIIERNKQIALMLGFKEATLEYKLKWCSVPTEERLNRLNQANVPILVDKKDGPVWEDSLNWHLDWNLLHEAINFLQQHFDDKEMVWTTIHRYHLYSNIEDIFIVVSDCAKHYNEKKI